MKILALIALVFATLANAQDIQETLIIEPDQIKSVTGHIQGSCVSEDAIYLSYVLGIIKLDWNGKFIKEVSLPNHNGDVAYHKGKIYSAVSLKGGGEIHVFDADLNPIKKISYPHGFDGIGVLNDAVYVGIGPNPHTPHRGNKIGKFDLDLNEIKVVNFDHGFETHYGAQNITTDGKYLYVFFYNATKGGHPCAVIDEDINLIKTIRFSAGTGIDFLPISPTNPNGTKLVRSVHVGDWKKAKKGEHKVAIEPFEKQGDNFVRLPTKNK